MPRQVWYDWEGVMPELGGGSGGVACDWVYFIPRLVVKISNVCCKAQLILRDAPVRWRYWVDNACRSAVEAGVGAGEIV